MDGYYPPDLQERRDSTGNREASQEGKRVKCVLLISLYYDGNDTFDTDIIHNLANMLITLRLHSVCRHSEWS